MGYKCLKPFRRIASHRVVVTLIQQHMHGKSMRNVSTLVVQQIVGWYVNVMSRQVTTQNLSHG